MKRVTLYSSSSRSRSPVRPSGTSPPDQAGRNDKALESPSIPVPPLLIRLWKLIQRHNHALWVVAGGLLALLLVWGYESMAPTPGRITQKDIDRAVLHTLETQTLPSPAAKAYEAIMPSVVRVRGLDTDPDGDDEIAHLELVGIPECDHREALGRHFDDGDVGLRVAPGADVIAEKLEPAAIQLAEPALDRDLPVGMQEEEAAESEEVPVLGPTTTTEVPLTKKPGFWVAVILFSLIQVS